jgi:hypothetical protein
MSDAVVGGRVAGNVRNGDLTSCRFDFGLAADDIFEHVE